MKHIFKYSIVSLIFVLSMTIAFAYDYEDDHIDSVIIDNTFVSGSYGASDNYNYTKVYNYLNCEYLYIEKNHMNGLLTIVGKGGSVEILISHPTYGDTTEVHDYGTDTFRDGAIPQNNFQTNLPIFLDTQTEDIENYKNGGGFDNAYNINDLTPQPELENNLPKPERITLTNESMKQQQNIFINDVTFQVESSDYANLQGKIECSFFVDIDLLRTHTVLGITNNTVLTDAVGGHNDTVAYSGTVNYENGVATVKVPASALNEQVARIYEKNDIVFGSSNAIIASNQIYLNKLTISARSEYVQGSEYPIGSWSPSLNFAYNYVTKTATAYKSPEPNNPTDGEDLPDTTPNDETPNGYNDNGNGGQYNIQIKNDYPKYNLYNNLNKTLTGSGELKTQMDSAFGFFDTVSHSGYLSVLATFMPYISDDYWNLFKIAITSALSFGVIGCVFRFLRG